MKLTTQILTFSNMTALVAAGVKIYSENNVFADKEASEMYNRQLNGAVNQLFVALNDNDEGALINILVKKQLKTDNGFEESIIEKSKNRSINE